MLSAALLDGFEGRDDGLKTRLGLAKVVAQAEVTVRIGTGNQATVGGGLLAVDVEELGVV